MNNLKIGLQQYISIHVIDKNNLCYFNVIKVKYITLQARTLKTRSCKFIIG